MLKLSDFDYNLPKELIAQYPSQKRDEARLLILHRDTGKIEHRLFKDIVGYFHKDDLLILNDTKVVPARLVGKKYSGGKIELLILPTDEANRKKNEYKVLVRPLRGCRVGTKIIFGNGVLEAEIVRLENKRRFLKFDCNGNFEKLLDKLGQMPLPPYIKRKPEIIDRKRYQTVYASKKGAVAAPTAGLHFTKRVLSCIYQKGVDIEYLTLHVGYGTFKAVRCEDIKSHDMEKEYFEIKKQVIEKLKSRRKGRTITVGTTTCRVLETIGHYGTKGLAMTDSGYYGWADLFIYPPYNFSMVDALLTNFHLSKTTLLMLVSAFCGRELLFKAYEEAIKRRYRFYSYGDAMLII